MTVKEAIQRLQAIKEQDAPLYFDCPNCGRCNELYLVGVAVVARTQEAKVKS